MNTRRLTLIGLSFFWLSSVQANPTLLPMESYDWINYVQEQRQEALGLNQWYPTDKDPYQGFNRTAHDFNMSLDTWIVKPISRGYEKLPSPIKTGTHNFFNNLSEPLTFVNCLLQAKGTCATNSFWRFVFNSTFGLLGVLDVATEMGIQEQDEDFGQTFVHWGISEGHYLVLPFFGPSTTTNAFGQVFDSSYDTLNTIENTETYYALYCVKLVDKRASLLGATDLIDEQKLDSYSFMRDSYLQIRKNQYFDGQPPIDPSLDAYQLDDADLQLKLN